jgi:hypothetical protein
MCCYASSDISHADSPPPLALFTVSWPSLPFVVSWIGCNRTLSSSPCSYCWWGWRSHPTLSPTVHVQYSARWSSLAASWNSYWYRRGRVMAAIAWPYESQRRVAWTRVLRSARWVDTHPWSHISTLRMMFVHYAHWCSFEGSCTSKSSSLAIPQNCAFLLKMLQNIISTWASAT